MITFLLLPRLKWSTATIEIVLLIELSVEVMALFWVVVGWLV